MPSLLGCVASMPSVFTRLFRFSRSSKKAALENFTTEALAAALRKDAGPFVRALIEDGVELASGSEAEAVVVETQVSVGKGIIDLVVELRCGADRDLLWVELKAHAGLSGNQLAIYAQEAKTYAPSLRPQVIMLCKRPIADVPTVRWNTVRRAILDAGDGADRYWTELCSFLEENRVADDYDTPITSSELETAAAARSLMRKTSRIASEFLKTMRKEAGDGSWKDCEFPSTESRIEAGIARQFRQHGRLVTFSKRYPWACFGMTFNPRPMLAVWIEFRPKDIDAREAVFPIAKHRLDAETWVFDSPGWPSIRAAIDAESCAEQAVALDWLRARFDELEDAKVFAELKKWRWKDRDAAQESEA